MDPGSQWGSTPTWPSESTIVVPFRRTTASSPLNHPEPFVWSAWARIVAEAEEWARTYTSPLASAVPVRLIVSPAEALPLKNIWTL